MFENNDLAIILASASKIRADLLERTGLSFAIEPADVDETAIRDIFTSNHDEIDPGDIAEMLAQAKAAAIANQKPDALIIGADQVLSLEGKLFEKPKTMDEAKANLFQMRGKTHSLHSSIVVMQGGSPLWRFTDQADLTMRHFSSEFLGKYCAIAGADILSSVGAYKLESHGIHLFEEIKGDYFSILGFPILPLLNFLRKEGMIIS